MQLEYEERKKREDEHFAKPCIFICLVGYLKTTALIMFKYEVRMPDSTSVGYHIYYRLLQLSQVSIFNSQKVNDFVSCAVSD
ncbi:unnamed protein product [Acanthoscelides obtectus]|uniref:Uncharacterized protein n=1 Tax=Acanthoscelides obtectus TaxID=200917 RepID=A0A9P0QIK4_ACAOB|nr:unnamed protein product [Acanthoscelides obtectus]CAK1655537.1 hypothetical protein AOBTE_LOCUS19209 [Acanthoscelides obtectus]